MTTRPIRMWDGAEWIDVTNAPMIPAATSAQGDLADTAVQPEDLGGAALLDVGTTAGTVAAGDDVRFTDERVPTDSSVTLAKLADNSATVVSPDAPVSPKIGTVWVDSDGTVDELLIPVPTAQIADGAITQPKFAPGLAPVLVGEGSPLGVITPDYPGQVYSDSEITCGASLWRATGLTSSDWTVAVGDTGWRDVGGLLTNGWTSASASLRVRRVGDMVEWVTRYIIGSSKTADDFIAVPVGFKIAPPNYEFFLPAGRTSSGTTIITYSPSHTLSSTLTGTFTGGRWSYLTNDPWPTVLPGVAV